MKQVKRLRVEVTPFYFVEGGDELRVRVLVNDREYTFERALLDDDMTSRFDYLFDMAKQALREAIAAEDRVPANA